MSHLINMSVGSNTDKQHAIFTDTLSYFGLCSSSEIKSTSFRKTVLHPSSGKEAPKLVAPLDRDIFNHWLL